MNGWWVYVVYKFYYNGSINFSLKSFRKERFPEYKTSVLRGSLKRKKVLFQKLRVKPCEGGTIFLSYLVEDGYFRVFPGYRQTFASLFLPFFERSQKKMSFRTSNSSNLFKMTFKCHIKYVKIAQALTVIRRITRIKGRMTANPIKI